MKNNNPMKNKEVSEKVSNTQKGRKLSQEHKNKISKTLKGRVFSEETLKKFGKEIVAFDDNGDVILSFISSREAHRNGYDRYKIKKSIENNIKFKNLYWKYVN